MMMLTSKLILSSTSEYDSTSLNLFLSSHTAFHLILFTISLYSYMLYIKQLHAYIQSLKLHFLHLLLSHLLKYHQHY